MADENLNTERGWRPAVCHPDRKHHVRGLCRRCYSATPAEKTARAKRDNAPGRRAERAICSAARYRRPGVKEMRAISRNAPARKAVKAAYDASYYMRRKTDLVYRLRVRLRVRLNCAVRNGQRTGSAIRDLGCSIEHLKLHLELFWDDGMSWENWGKRAGQWSIDHIRPLSSFDLMDRTQFLEASHYTNLRPLWHTDNLHKGKSVDNANDIRVRTASIEHPWR